MRKLIVPLTMAFALGAFGTSAMADNVEDDFPDDFDDTSGDDLSPAVPEPGAALAMGAGLATIAFALRRRR